MSFNFFIIGLGQIGCSLALALKKAKTARRILGKDLYKRKFYHKIIDEYVDEIKEGVERADIIIISTPVKKIISLIREIAPIMNGKKILLDTGSTKKEVLNEMRKFPEKIIIGGHPMAGTIKKGKKAISEKLFSGKPFFISFPNENSKKGRKIIEGIIKSIEAIPIEVNEEEHDFYTSIVSHIPYAISITLYSIFLDFYRKDKRIENFISTGFLGATRLALTDSQVAEDILITNKFNVISLIDTIIHKLEELKIRIDEEALKDFIFEIKKDIEKRRKLYENTKF
jgi:prephenate dehydrogenase